MIYSVWSQAQRAYDYYRTPERSEDTSAPKASHLRHGPLGLAPEDAAWPLPANAVWYGRGKYAKGFIASARSPGQALSGLLNIDFTITNLGLLALSGYLVWKYVPHPRRA